MSDLLKDMKHPVQPIGYDGEGVIRFKPNSIINWLFETKKLDLNQVRMMVEDTGGDFPLEDYTQLMQLLGYSVSGYGDLSTSPQEIVVEADKIAAQLYEERKKKDDDGTESDED